MKKARKASYWRWRGVAGSAKKRRQSVRSNGTLIDITYNVKHQIWCQSSFAVQTLTTTRNPYMTPVFMPNRIFVDNVCCLITNNETSRNCSISAPVRLTSRAKLLSQMNPIAGSMSADSRSVEIQASRGNRPSPFAFVRHVQDAEPSSTPLGRKRGRRCQRRRRPRGTHRHKPAKPVKEASRKVPAAAAPRLRRSPTRPRRLSSSARPGLADKPRGAAEEFLMLSRFKREMLERLTERLNR